MLGFQPGTVQPVVDRRRAEVPQEQLAGAGVAPSGTACPCPLADGHLGEAADVVVEEEQRA